MQLCKLYSCVERRCTILQQSRFSFSLFKSVLFHPPLLVSSLSLLRHFLHPFYMPLIVSLFISTIFYPTLCLLSQSFLPPVFSFVFSVTQQHFRSPYAWLASLVATWLCTLRFFSFFFPFLAFPLLTKRYVQNLVSFLEILSMRYEVVWGVKEECVRGGRCGRAERVAISGYARSGRRRGLSPGLRCGRRRVRRRALGTTPSAGLSPSYLGRRRTGVGPLTKAFHF